MERFSTLQTENEDELSFTATLAAMKRMPPEGRRPFLEIMTSLLGDAPAEIQRLTKHFQTMTPEQLASSISAGNWVGGHTHSHTILSVLPDTTAKEEISRNRELLMEVTDKAGIFFAYPNGGPDDFQENHQEMLRDAGYEIAFSLTHRRSDVLGTPYDVSRFHVAQEDSICSLAFRSTGAGLWVERIRPLFP